MLAGAGGGVVQRMRKRLGVGVIAAAAALVGLAGAAQAQTQCGKTGIYLFSAHWCRYCKETEAFLDKHRVAYRRIEVTKNPEAQKYMMENYGTTAVPVMVVDREHVVGYDLEWATDALCFGRPGDARNRAPEPAPRPDAGPARTPVPGPAPAPARAPARSAASVGTPMEPMRAP